MLIVDTDVALGEPPSVGGLDDGGGVQGVRRPAEDMDGVGDIAATKVLPAGGIDPRASFREITLLSCSW